MSLTLTISYAPHQGQRLFHLSKAKNRIWLGGRQSGKTIAGAQESIRLCMSSPSNTVGFIVAPTYWHTQRCWREILKILTPLFGKAEIEVNRAEHRITLPSNRNIWFKSADDPDSLRSEHLDWAWLDECAMIKEEGYNAVEPALYGPAIFTSTPKGHNWVYGLWTRGQDPLQRDLYESWKYPTSINPYYPKEKIEHARKTLPELVFKQEYLGEFIEDIGAVFRNVESHIKPLSLTPQPATTYVVGADLAKTEDYTVLFALNPNGEVHGYERFNQLDWTFQCQRIVSFCQRYNGARLLLDSTGLGDPIFDELRRMAVSVDGYKLNNASKANLVENLSLMLDNNQISYPHIPELISEFGTFGYEQGRTGTIQYRAYEGYHDDTVIALALAAWLIRTSGPLQISGVNAPW